MVRQFIGVLAAVALGAGLPASAAAHSADPLSLQVSPLILFAEGDVSVRLRVEPDARSRAMTVEWWSPEGGGGLHLINLEGDRAAIRHTFVIKHLAAGDYTVAVALQRSDGTRVVRSVPLTVIACSCVTPRDAAAARRKLPRTKALR